MKAARSLLWIAAAVSLLCLGMPAIVVAITATPTATAIIRSVRGRVSIPGEAGLVPAATVPIEVFACERSACLGESGAGTAGETTATGDLFFGMAANGPMVIRAFIDAQALRALVFEDGEAMVDPVSEAMVQLIEERELYDYGRAQLGRIQEEIRRANAAESFAGLSLEAAVTLARGNARADAAVEAALAVWTPTPTPTATSTPAPTDTPTPYPAVPTATRRPCVGDCDRSGRVSIDELVTGILLVVGSASPARCAAYSDPQVAQILEAVDNALHECVPPAPRPDLTFDDERGIYVFDLACGVDERCAVACIVNAGDAGAPAFDVLFGRSQLGEARARLPGLGAGQGQCVRSCTSSNSLSFSGMAWVDPDAVLTESREDNNARTFSFPTPTPSSSCP